MLIYDARPVSIEGAYCFNCKGALAVGEMARWNATKHKLWCLNCCAAYDDVPASKPVNKPSKAIDCAPGPSVDLSPLLERLARLEGENKQLVATINNWNERFAKLAEIEQAQHALRMRMMKFDVFLESCREEQKCDPISKPDDLDALFAGEDEIPF